MWSNFHTHSSYCDGKGELSHFVKHAIELQVRSLGFSSHAPLPFDCNWSMKEESLPVYLREINTLKLSKHEIELHAGLEVDYIPSMISPNQFKHQLDFVIGSIHFVEKMKDGTPWEIDGSHNSFLQGLETIFRNNIRDVIFRYYELTREMILSATPDIVGHLDKIKIQNLNNRFLSEDDSWYKSEIIKTIDVIQDAGTIVEVNTRGLYQQKSTTPYPSPWILEILCQRNIPVTISSDAHHPGDLINKFYATAELLKKIGFKKISVLHEGKWMPFKLSSHGVTIS